MSKNESNLSEYLGKYVYLQDGRKGLVLAPSEDSIHYRFLTLKNRLDNASFKLEIDNGFLEYRVWRELGTMEHEPMQPYTLISDLRELIEDGKRFRELQRLLK